MPALPANFILDQIRGLRGKARVTYPDANVAVKKVERITTLPKDNWEIPYLSVDDEHAGCLLVMQEKVSEDGKFVEVYRAYETLPGSWVPFTRYSDDLGPVQGRRRAVQNAGQLASLSSTTSTTYEGREGSSIVSMEIEETWTNGSGSGGNPAFPIGVSDVYDETRGPVQTTTQLFVKTGNEEGTLIESGGVITETGFVPFNEFLLKRSVEVSAIPGPDRAGQNYDKTLGVAFPFVRTIVATGTATPHADINPINKEISEQELVDISAAQAVLDAIHMIYPSQESVRLPDELKSVDVHWDASGTESRAYYGGSASSVVIDMLAGQRRAFNFTFDLSCNAVVGGDYVVNIKEGFTGSVPSEIHSFFLPYQGTPISPNAIMSKCNAVAWPVHRPESYTIVLFGEELKVALSSKIIGFTPANAQSGTTIITQITENRAKAKMIKTLHIPPTIHPLITVNEIGSSTATGTASDAAGNTLLAEVNGRLSSSDIPATNISFFSAGRYILSSTVKPYGYGRALVTATVVEITPDYL